MGGACSGHQHAVKIHDSTVDHHVISTAKNPRNPHFQGDPSRKSSLLGISLNQTQSTPQNASHSVNDRGGPVICSGHAEINHFFYDENGKPRHDIGQRLPSSEMSRSRNGRTPRTPRDRRASMPQINRVSGSDTAGALGYHHEFISRTESDPSSEVSRPRKKETTANPKTHGRRKSMTDFYDSVYQWEGGQIKVLPDATAKSGWGQEGSSPGQNAIKEPRVSQAASLAT